MPRQNRVTPFGKLIATRERGTLNGNRGCLHDEAGNIRRPFRGERWIICVLEFKGRRHPIMWPGWYTDLFFLDEATALAAGHRPCAECQRKRFSMFRETWAAANPDIAGSVRPLAPAMDAVLHAERTGPRRSCDAFDSLPDGVFVSDNDIEAFLVSKGRLLLWTPAGYTLPQRTVAARVRILTPRTIVRTLEAGYPVGVHASAF